MPTTVTDFVNVRQRAADFGCPVPQTLTILPFNFTSAATAADFLRASEAATVRTLFRLNSITVEELLATGHSPSYVEHNDFEWVAPALFIPAALMSQNPEVVSLALGVLANYITDFFKGHPGPRRANINIIVEKDGDWSCKIIHYDGDVSGMPREIADFIGKLHND
jgi:hypothetical protein